MYNRGDQKVTGSIQPPNQRARKVIDYLPQSLCVFASLLISGFFCYLKGGGRTSFDRRREV